ncbi:MULTISPECIES: 50S ribosomal protein L30 [unclassified Fusibacter]|uniref:50S ribosomal protein L30 n=1 Tax=unclassified Fusibacter TaxID=2624464 RepID=UPI0010136DBB|nr:MULTISPECIES: 50S ribosomal protein L30 [unclassified Fusibacter]MCK8061530.1 50S ribosomal protein L30 [Fusibacter sp. A2]NPE23742.1 50S ribosomal protein L30 [Fusibacter sp. A1]RXV58769.1 50S ribosomal protein L30 [Fusibacter sp. A1]
MAKLQIKLVKSTIGAIPKHRKTVQALGLRKLNQVVEQNDNPQIRGMIKQVVHLLEVKEV